MSIQIKEENLGKLLVVRVSGQLVAADYESLVPELERLVKQHGKLCLLFEMTDFHGWNTCATWEDTRFAMNIFYDISRIAMVGEMRWKDGMAMFCRPFMRATIRYFPRADAFRVRSWLDKP